MPLIERTVLLVKAYLKPHHPVTFGNLGKSHSLQSKKGR
jgi:hypothetical protein